jgi:hypothetical protein
MNRAAAAQARYRQGEVHRLRGEFAAAEEAYQDASRGGGSRSRVLPSCAWPRRIQRPQAPRSAAL